MKKPDKAAIRKELRQMLKEANERITWLGQFGKACGLDGRLPEAIEDRERIERRIELLREVTA